MFLNHTDGTSLTATPTAGQQLSEAGVATLNSIPCLVQVLWPLKEPNTWGVVQRPRHKSGSRHTMAMWYQRAACGPASGQNKWGRRWAHEQGKPSGTSRGELAGWGEGSSSQRPKLASTYPANTAVRMKNEKRDDLINTVW